MRWLAGITDTMDGYEFEQTLGDSEKQGRCVLQSVGSESDVT